VILSPLISHLPQPDWIIKEGTSPNQNDVWQEICKEGNDKFREHFWLNCEPQQGNLGCPVVQEGSN